KMTASAPDHRHRFNGFRPEAFQFLADLAAHNTKKWFDAHRQEFIKYLDEPLRALVTALGPFMRARRSDLETAPKSGKTLSRINKNIFGHVDEGLYNTEYWAAFYRYSQTKQTDLQLYLGLRADCFEAGLYCSARAGARLEAFRNQILNNK